MLDGRIYHGAKPGEAEIGHVRLDRPALSGIAVFRLGGGRESARGHCGESIRFAGRTGRARRGRGGQFIGPALAGGDPDARRILDETAGDLGFGLSHVTQLFHPEAIVLGGGLSLIGEPLRAAVERSLRPFVMKAFQPGPKILLAGLGEDVVPVGALELAKGCSLGWSVAVSGPCADVEPQARLSRFGHSPKRSSNRGQTALKLGRMNSWICDYPVFRLDAAD